jgi:RNA polymerase sigma-70 factor (ECF subfamily)
MPYLRTTTDLLRQFRNGERQALERVYWAYVERVETVVRHGIQLMRPGSAIHVKGLDREELADAVQEVFTRAFAARARLAYDGLRDYGPFLVAIARNLLVDLARKRGRELPLEELGEAWDPPASREEEPYADETTMSMVREYLSSLPAELRGVHEQRYVRGVSQEEAAQALGCSRQQLRTLEKRLRDGLAAHLERARTSLPDEAPTKIAAPAYGRRVP